MIYEIGILYCNANLNWNSWAQKFNLVWLRELFKEVRLWTYADYVECNNIIAKNKLPSNTVMMHRWRKSDRYGVAQQGFEKQVE
jgi:hypothetical protein